MYSFEYCSYLGAHIDSGEYTKFKAVKNILNEAYGEGTHYRDYWKETGDAKTGEWYWNLTSNSMYLHLTSQEQLSYLILRFPDWIIYNELHEIDEDQEA